MDIITSLDNASVKEARSLNDKKYRRFYGKFLVEGRKLVSEVVKKGLQIDKIFVDYKKSQQFEDIIYSTDTPILFTNASIIKSISDTETPQGIIAVVSLPIAGFYNYQAGDRILVLDKLSDPGNMGTIIRSACATGFKHIFTIECVDPYSPKVVRSASGGLLDVNIYPSDYDEVLNICKKHNIELLVADMNGANIYDNFSVNGDYAVVIGNEGNGVGDIFKNAGKLIRLPMKPEMESLNAGVSASIIMYALEGKNID